MSTSDVDLTTVWTSLVEDSGHGGLVQRRVLPRSGHDCFLGFDHQSGRRALRVQARAQRNVPSEPSPSAEGFRVQRTVEGDTVQLTVTLTNPVLLDPFLSLVQDLVEVIDLAAPSETASALLGRVSAWMTFFQSKGPGMGKEAAAGLFAELTVLRSVVAALGPDEGVSAWEGPDKSRQDFVFADSAMEVKSWRGNGHARPTISSEHQLDTTGCGALRLVIVTLDQRSAGPGQRIADLADEVRALLAASPAALVSFNTKLIAYGWAGTTLDHRSEAYEVHLREDFEIRPGFPRLVPSNLPNGVSHVTYKVDRASIDAFLIPESNLGE